MSAPRWLAILMGVIIVMAALPEAQRLAGLADPRQFAGGSINAILAIPYLAAGPYLALRQPRNAVGWLFGLSSMVLLLGGAIRSYALLAGIEIADLPTRGLGLVLLMYAIFVFPRGRMRSWPWTLAAIGVAVLGSVLGA